MHTSLRLPTGIMICCILLASCNGTPWCNRTSGCVTILVKQLSNDSVVLDTARCSYSINGMHFQDSLRQVTAPYSDETRYSIAFADSATSQSNVSIKGKEVADYEARGYTCSFPK